MEWRMLLSLDDRHATTLLGAAKTVAMAGGDGGGTVSDAAALAIASLAETGLGTEAPDVGTLGPVSPGQLAAAVDDGAHATTAAEVLAIMALVDGTRDAGRVGSVLEFAQALDCRAEWLGDLSLSLEADLRPMIADMGDRNLRSVTDGRLDLSDIDDISHWLMPYEDNEDTALAARYAVLSALAPGTLGHAFWSFYDRHHFVFPGQAGAVNEMFGTPHDCTHVISGYDTTPQGELLVSTFTSRMHPVFPMAGHVLPVIYSWHVGIEFNKLAGSYKGALDPAKFWVAWDRGLQTTADTFAQGFSFWDHAEDPLDDVRAAFSVAPLDPAHAASSQGAVAGVDYHPIA
jgi:hypothetical protein